MIYLRLYYEFFKTGLFAIGGGLVTIPFLSEMGQKFNWFTQAELTNMIAISESTPGPIGINMATYVGFKVGGVLGSLCATIGEVTPALIIIMIIAGFLKEFRENKYVERAFTGIRPTVIGLIVSAIAGIFFSSVIFLNKYKASGNIADLFDIRTIGIFIVIFIANKKWKIHPIFYVIVSAILGIILGL